MSFANSVVLPYNMLNVYRNVGVKISRQHMTEKRFITALQLQTMRRNE